MGRQWTLGLRALSIITFVWLVGMTPLVAQAAPYAALVMDARNGEVLHSENADTRLHPASLTKMMTLYIAFEAVQNGELSMDTMVTISRAAASEPPSKLGLRAGQQIKLRYLVRAAAVKSANDAATAIGEAIEGSESAFARRMNRTAQAMGMTNTTFKNAHGLTESGHLSTARDMSVLGRHIIYDYPQYYNLFSRVTADAGVRQVAHTNRRLLRSYSGADGIKTGYTNAAGFNLVASARRGNERVIATVFGGRSTATRNARVEELLDLGFSKSPTRVAVNPPEKPPYMGKMGAVLVAHNSEPAPGRTAKAIRQGSAAVERSLRPMGRPLPNTPEPAAPPAMVAEVAADIEAVVAEVAAAAGETAQGSAEPDPEDAAQVLAASVRPMRRSAAVEIAAAEPTPAREAEVITRVSTSGGRQWGINVGRYPSRFAAEKVLLETHLSELSTLDGALRKVVRGSSGFDANFLGLSRETADLACRKLQARNVSCFMIGPGS